MRSISPTRVLIVAHQTSDSHALIEAVARRAEGSVVVGMVGSHEPFAAVQDALNLFGFDEVIVSMLPARVSRWLRLDLPRKVRALGVPVTEVIGVERDVSPLGASTQVHAA